MKNKMSKNAIKEAFDNLPSGICFFDKNEIPVLCNRQMHKLIHELSGRDLQMLSDITDATKDKNILFLSDGTAWQFAKSIVSPDGVRYTQYIASNVTDIYNKRKRLEKSNSEYIEMIENMKKITDNVVSITREEEILALKMQIHSNVGIALQRLKHFSASRLTVADKQSLVDELNKVIAMLKNEIGNDDQPDVFDELNTVAKNIGAEILFDGELPDEKKIRVLLAHAVRECLTNTLYHAEGNRVFVSLKNDRNILEAVITNNGKKPVKEIVEGGGLSALRKRIEGSGGNMIIQSEPFFALCVAIPCDI